MSIPFSGVIMRRWEKRKKQQKSTKQQKRKLLVFRVTQICHQTKINFHPRERTIVDDHRLISGFKLPSICDFRILYRPIAQLNENFKRNSQRTLWKTTFEHIFHFAFEIIFKGQIAAWLESRFSVSRKQNNIIKKKVLKCSVEVAPAPETICYILGISSYAARALSGRELMEKFPFCVWAEGASDNRPVRWRKTMFKEKDLQLDLAIVEEISRSKRTYMTPPPTQVHTNGSSHRHI